MCLAPVLEHWGIYFQGSYTSGKFIFFQGQGIVREKWNVWSWYNFHKFIKFPVLILSWKFEFVSGKCHGILVSPKCMNPDLINLRKNSAFFFSSWSYAPDCRDYLSKQEREGSLPTSSLVAAATWTTLILWLYLTSVSQTPMLLG